MKFFDYVHSINDFCRARGLNVDPIPTVVLNKEVCDRFDPFIATGRFLYVNNTIELCIDNRQLKDILRTYCHELVHADQFHSDPELFIEINKAGTLLDNEDLAELESDAYLRGNMLFRQWTEQFTH